MTNIGPLTTTFTASSCPQSSAVNIIGCGSGCVYWAAGALTSAISTCYPSSYNQLLSHYYSPGICPSGYTPACTSTNRAGSIVETIQTCCPTALGLTYGCATPIHPWMTSLGCVVSLSEGDSMYTFMSVTSVVVDATITIPTEVAQVGIGAYGVEIRFQSTDFVPASTTTSSSTTSSTSNATPSSTSAGTSTSGSSIASPTSSASGTTTSTSTSSQSAASNSGSSGKLSTPAAIGTGVGVAIAAILLFGLGLFFGRRSLRARKAASQGASGQEATSVYTDPHYPPSYQQNPHVAETAAYYNHAAVPAELGGQTARKELDSQGARQELGNEGARQELDSDMTRHEMPASTKR